MPDPRFFISTGPLALGEALRIADAAMRSSVDLTARISRVASLDEIDLEDAAVFAEDAQKAALLRGRRFGLCLAPDAIAKAADGAFAATAFPRAAFASLAAALHEPRTFIGDNSKPAIIDGSARIHSTAIIGPGSEIGADAEIGAHVVIGPGVVIGADAVVAEGASIWCALTGARGRIGPGSAIGGPGFGFAEGPGGPKRVPQLGRVLIGDDVEIGANVCIDRGALGDTIIGDMTKIDNLVQIGHNVRLGRACIMAAQTGVAGSAILGDHVQCGGQAGIGDHLTIGDGARIAGKAGVMSNVPAGETWGGYPARPIRSWLRDTAKARAAEPTKRMTDHDD